jgi:hypothetical protein
MNPTQLILATSAEILVPRCYIGRPAPAYGEGDPGGGDDGAGVGAAVVDKAFPDIGSVQGEQKPDWANLDAKYGGGTDDVVPPAKDPTRGDPLPDVPPVKPDTDAAKKPDAKPESAATPPKTPEKPEKPATAPPDATKKDVTQPAITAKPPEAPKPDAKKAFDPDEAQKLLDAIQPKPGASQKTLDGFKDIKEITARAIAANKELQAQVAAAKQAAEAVPKQDPAVEKELQELREFRATWEAENDPVFVEQHTKQLTAAEDKILKTLTTDRDLLMPQEQADMLKKNGFDSPLGREHINHILNTLHKTGNFLLFDRVKKMFDARGAVVEAKEARLEELRTKQGGFLEAKQKAEEAERQTWGKTADSTLIELFKEAKWGHYIEITEGMDPAAKAQAEAHNKRLETEIVPKIREGIQAVYNRDPNRSMEYIFKAFALDAKEAELQTANAEITKLQERVQELEGIAGGVRRISDPTNNTGAPTGQPVNAAGDFGQSAEESIDAFLAGKNKRV